MKRFQVLATVFTKQPDGRVVPKSIGQPNDALMVKQPIVSKGKAGKPVTVPKKI